MKKVILIIAILLFSVAPFILIESTKAKEDKYDNYNFSRDQMKQGYEFAEKIKQAVRTKNIAAFADFVSYPITVGTASVQNKEQLIQFGADRIFTEKFIKEICKDEDLFVSYRGFMMGNGPNLFFIYMDDGLPKIYVLNI